MKKLAFFVSTLIAGAAVASSVSSATTFGVLKVTSTNEETVISVPWVAAGTGGAVKVKDLVKTTDMIEGDELYLYNTNTSEFVGWQYSDDDHAWVAMLSVEESSKFGGVTLVTNEVATVDQGSALVIKRKARTLPATMPENIYLYGQYAASTSISVGYSTTQKFTTLFAPVNLTGDEVHLNDLGDNGATKYLKWENAVAGDKIRLQDAEGYVVTYTLTAGGKWSFMNSDDGGTDGVLQAGQGAWYIAKAGERSGAPTCEIADSTDNEDE